MKKAVYQEIGAFLRDKRMKRGLTQREAAEMLGYSSPQFISNCERGICAIPIRALKELGVVYQVSDEEILRVLVRSHRSYWMAELKKASSLN